MKVNRDRASRTIFCWTKHWSVIALLDSIRGLEASRDSRAVPDLDIVSNLTRMGSGLLSLAFLVWLWFSTDSCVTRTIASVALKNGTYLACLESSVEPGDKDRKDGAESNGM